MGRQRKKHRESENHERWIVSYADFITLLFAFFVVMYSISSVNEGKYRVLSQTLTDAFQEPKRSLEPIQVGELTRGDGDGPGIAKHHPLAMTEQDALGFQSTVDDPHLAGLTSEMSSQQQRFGYLAAVMENMLADYMEKDLVEIRLSENQVMIDMKDKMLFPSGSVQLSRHAVKILRDISRILAPLPYQLQIEGNTDNRPIHTEEFPSNWELSAARAASVVHLMTRMGVAPERMSAIGYAEYRPIADNNTEEGRQKNRRVSLVVLGKEDLPRQSISLTEKTE